MIYLTKSLAKKKLETKPSRKLSNTRQMQNYRRRRRSRRKKLSIDFSARPKKTFGRKSKLPSTKETSFCTIFPTLYRLCGKL